MQHCGGGGQGELKPHMQHCGGGGQGELKPHMQGERRCSMMPARLPRTVPAVHAGGTTCLSLYPLKCGCPCPCKYCGNGQHADPLVLADAVGG